MKLACMLGALIGAFPLLTVSALEAPAHPLKPMLWKVEGKDLEEPSWLFGTIHIGDGPVAKLHPTAEKAFNDADDVYTEIQMDEAFQLGLADNFIRKDGKTLQDSIGAELTRQLETELKEINPALDAKPFQALKTWAVAVSVPMLEFQLDGGKALDQIIWEKAKQAGKSTAPLEKPEDQFSIFENLTEEEQVILLSESLRVMKEGREQNENSVRKLVDAYISGEDKLIEAEIEKQLVELSKSEHKEIGEKLLKALLDKRNLMMTDVMCARMKEQPGHSHFFAIGTGHYLGRMNIVELLRKQGYEVTRITE